MLAISWLNGGGIGNATWSLCVPALSGDIGIYIIPVRYFAAFPPAPFFNTHEFRSCVSLLCLPFQKVHIYCVQYEDQAVANCASHANYDYINKTKVIFTMAIIWVWLPQPSTLLYINVRASVAFPIDNDRASWALLGPKWD